MSGRAGGLPDPPRRRQTRVVSDALFRYNRPGLAAAFAVLLFLLVIPIVTYNVIQMRKDA